VFAIRDYNNPWGGSYMNKSNAKKADTYHYLMNFDSVEYDYFELKDRVSINP
jgi:hypothetical protein